ncbi:PEP-CTERM sorting domain-containing protein [Methylophilus sp. UBA6697]|uniref:PEP-CTERM sorting domain-containing protein n=1 Tax=Methylophilus sp. UBA6697 TaxID=1946902 RepID=UPI0025F6E314|nr:PEP-CTERM sorting domain-containing protein [Methylophilus sp. UBA6697]
MRRGSHDTHSQRTDFTGMHICREKKQGAAMSPWLKRIRNASLLTYLLSGTAWGGYYPMYASWPQPNGIGSDITLTYSYSNLFDGGVISTNGQSLSVDIMRSAFEQAFADYAAVLPIHFIEVADAGGPLPETGQYDPTGLADIRIGVVPYISDANAYAYFPQNTAVNGLAGDVVFNGQRFGLGWTQTIFYSVAQHELGHSLGMGHYINADESPDDTIANAAYTGPIFPLDSMMITALQNVYGAGLGSVTPLSAVPEPNTWTLLMAGLSLLILGRRERKPT